jgi:site-specific recombinase XerC
MVTTGLRVGDTLRVERGALAGILESSNPIIHMEVKGGIYRPVPIGVREPWEALARGVLAGKAANVAQYVCAGSVGPDVRGSCAYHRVNRRLKTLQRQLGLSGRANTHRIRRTIAVHTLEETDNIVATQQMMGHRTMQSTLKYVDERNHRGTARLQRKLAGLE